MAKKKTAPKKSSTKKQSTAVKKQSTPTKKVAPVKKSSTKNENRGAGRPPGHRNYTPPDGISVRDTGRFKGHFGQPVGPRWIRVYAGDAPDSLTLLALKTLIDKKDASLSKLLAKTAKEIA